MAEETDTIKKQNDELFEKEFLPHVDALYNFAFHLTYNEDDANDLVQDTFLKAYRFIDSYERGTNAKAWLFKILKNGFINEYRRKTRQPAEVDYEDFLTYQETDDGAHVGELDLRDDLFKGLIGDEVTKAINDLPVDFRTVILLCDVEGFTYEEIAKIIDIPIGTVRSRLHRARNLMKEKLRDYAKKWGIRKIAEALGFKSKKQKNMYDCKETMKHVMMALDGELSQDEEVAFLSHINHCSRCLEKYEIEKSFKQFLTEKISRHNIPSQLIDQIRSRILGKADR